MSASDTPVLGALAPHVLEALRLAANEEDSTARALCATARLSTATAEGARQAKEGARPGGGRAHEAKEGARPGGRRAQAKEVRELSTAQAEGVRLQQSLRNALLADASRQKEADEAAKAGSAMAALLAEDDKGQVGAQHASKSKKVGKKKKKKGEAAC